MYEGDAYLGIDCGSTTTKLVLIGADDQILFHHYQSCLLYTSSLPVCFLQDLLLRYRCM